MNKPIILMPNRHWDDLSRRALLAALPLLAQFGYDAFCCELSEKYSTA